ncbi:MAG: hypothetical protein KC912_24000 [Proteobacteria bacterium]|nr:hypothetical protein [Pseudomonadota bacterium]
MERFDETVDGLTWTGKAMGHWLPDLPPWYLVFGVSMLAGGMSAVENDTPFWPAVVLSVVLGLICLICAPVEARLFANDVGLVASSSRRLWLGLAQSEVKWAWEDVATFELSEGSRNSQLDFGPRWRVRRGEPPLPFVLWVRRAAELRSRARDGHVDHDALLAARKLTGQAE